MHGHGGRFGIGGGAPHSGGSYRWSEIAIAEHLKNGLPWQIASRDCQRQSGSAFGMSLIARIEQRHTGNRPSHRPTLQRNLASSVTDLGLTAQAQRLGGEESPAEASGCFRGT
jgi:hypothetical protein